MALAGEQQLAEAGAHLDEVGAAGIAPFIRLVLTATRAQAARAHSLPTQPNGAAQRALPRCDLLDEPFGALVSALHTRS